MRDLCCGGSFGVAFWRLTTKLPPFLLSDKLNPTLGISMTIAVERELDNFGDEEVDNDNGEN